MGNFAVNASEDVIAAGKGLLDKLGRPGEKQGEVLARMFRMVEAQLDSETIRQGGVDVQALDASLSNIRTMFLTFITSKEQIVSAKDEKISEIKTLKDQMEKDLRDKLDTAIKEKDAAVADAEAAAKTAAQAVKDAEIARKQADTVGQLCSEKDETIATLKEKVSNYADLKKGYEDALGKLSELNDEIIALRRSAEDQKKDAEMALAAAVMEKEREYMGRLREADKETARLQAEVNILREQVLTSK